MLRGESELSHSRLQFEGDLIGQGQDAAKKALIEKPELAKKIIAAILAKKNPEPVAKTEKADKAEKPEKAEK